MSSKEGWDNVRREHFLYFAKVYEKNPVEASVKVASFFSSCFGAMEPGIRAKIRVALEEVFEKIGDKSFEDIGDLANFVALPKEDGGFK
jgi:hypothetical protein